MIYTVGKDEESKSRISFINFIKRLAPAPKEYEECSKLLQMGVGWVQAPLSEAVEKLSLCVHLHVSAHANPVLYISA